MIDSKAWSCGMLTSMRVSKRSSANLRARNQSLARNGAKSKVNLGIHIAGLNTPSRAHEACMYTMASSHFRVFIISKLCPNPKSPMLSKENQDIKSFMGTGSEPYSEITVSRTSTCFAILL